MRCPGPFPARGGEKPTTTLCRCATFWSKSMGRRRKQSEGATPNPKDTTPGQAPSRELSGVSDLLDPPGSRSNTEILGGNGACHVCALPLDKESRVCPKSCGLVKLPDFSAAPLDPGYSGLNASARDGSPTVFTAFSNLSVATSLDYTPSPEEVLALQVRLSAIENPGSDPASGRPADTVSGMSAVQSSGGRNARPKHGGAIHAQTSIASGDSKGTEDTVDEDPTQEAESPEWLSLPEWSIGKPRAEFALEASGGSDKKLLAFESVNGPSSPSTPLHGVLKPQRVRNSVTTVPDGVAYWNGLPPECGCSKPSDKGSFSSAGRRRCFSSQLGSDGRHDASGIPLAAPAVPAVAGCDSCGLNFCFRCLKAAVEARIAEKAHGTGVKGCVHVLAIYMKRCALCGQAPAMYKCGDCFDEWSNPSNNEFLSSARSGSETGSSSTSDTDITSSGIRSAAAAQEFVYCSTCFGVDGMHSAVKANGDKRFTSLRHLNPQRRSHHRKLFLYREAVPLLRFTPFTEAHSEGVHALCDPSVARWLAINKEMSLYQDDSACPASTERPAPSTPVTPRSQHRRRQQHAMNLVANATPPVRPCRLPLPLNGNPLRTPLL
ncbi:hypothetical protein DIPPA_57828 [Diplonema papillatum]|nr:hypothetical protein DIPPA_57828 [Diplonema papillatum]